MGLIEIRRDLVGWGDVELIDLVLNYQSKFDFIFRDFEL